MRVWVYSVGPKCGHGQSLYMATAKRGVLFGVDRHGMKPTLHPTPLHYTTFSIND